MKAPLTPIKPWYREPWPWLLMSGPAIVVVAGIITIVIAARTHDGLVVDDYYKQGKTINQSLHRDAVARQIGITATVTFDQANDQLNVVLRRADGQALPASISVVLVHATRSGADKIVTLSPLENGYTGKLPSLGAGKWNVLIEDTQKKWRLQKKILVDSKPLPLLQINPAGQS